MSAQIIHSPSVSVIFCTNVWDKYCDRSLSSIEAQTFGDFEVILVANCMDDITFERMLKRASDPRIHVFRTSIAGVTFSRNLALHHCRAPLIAVMDADDIAYPHRLQTQVNFFQNHSDAMVCGSSYNIIDCDDEVIGLTLLPVSNQEIRETLVWSNPLCHPTTMFRAAHARAVGGYSGSSAEDYELWIRLMEFKGCQFINLAEPLLGYRVPVVSSERRSRRAYSQLAGAQFRIFSLTKRPVWLIASLYSLLKAWFRSKQL